MNVQQTNLLLALNRAIRDQERAEKDMGYTSDSALLSGWREMYVRVAAGCQIVIIPSQV